MDRRRLPSMQDALLILGSKRTRPALRPPPPAGKLLAPALADFDKRFGQGPAGLQSRWREIVGEAIARHCEPIRVVKGRAGQPSALEIRVNGPAAALVQHQAAEIVARVNLFLGAGAVGRLRIIQGPLRPKPQAAARPQPRRPAPLDAAKEAELAAGLAGQPEGPLKAALESLGRSVLRGR
ncbi:MAG: DciA family protein [Phenylobacterium sp.]